MESVFFRLMKKLVRFLDPRFEKYRPPKKVQPYVPKTEDDFLNVIKRTPKTILNDEQRARIEGALSFDDFTVADIMLPRRKMKFLNENDELVPGYVNALYKTGIKIFPVLDSSKQISGLFHINSFELSDIVDDSILAHHLDKNLLFASSDYSLRQMLAAFLRSGSNYAIVIDEKMSIKGYLPLERLIAMMNGSEIKDDKFVSDADPSAVIRRNKKQ